MQYRWILFVLLSGLLARQQQTECFVFVDPNTRYAVSVPDGSISTNPSLGDTGILGKQISPDGTKEANFNITSSDVSLEVKKLESPIPLAFIRREQFDPQAEIDVNWSPNSHFIVYVWTKPGSDNTFLRLADADGITLRETLLTSSRELDAQIDTWSADSQFFTVLLQPHNELFSPGAKINVRFFSAPDLREVTPPGITSVPLSSCFWTDSYWQVYCTYWTRTGHQAAFVTRVDDDIRVVIVTAGSLTYKSYLEPALIQGAVSQDWFLLWSHDGQTLAVTHFTWKKQSEDKTITGQQLELYNVDGSAQTSLGESDFNAAFHADGRQVVPWSWAADSSTLYYVRETPSNKDNFDIVGYNISTQEKTVLLSFPYFGTFVDIDPSPDKRSVFVDIIGADGKPTFYLISPQGKQLWKQTFDSDFMQEYLQKSVWSPRNAYFGILQGYNLEIYNSSGGKIMAIKNNAEVGFVGYIGWTDCG